MKKWMGGILSIVIVLMLLVSIPQEFGDIKIPLVIDKHHIYITVLDDGKAVATVGNIYFRGGYAATTYGTLYFFQNDSFNSPQWLEVLVGPHGTAYRWQLYEFAGKSYILNAFYHKKENLLQKAELSLHGDGTKQDRLYGGSLLSSNDDYYLPMNKEAAFSEDANLEDVEPIKAGTELAPDTDVLIQYDVRGTENYYQSIHVEDGVRVQPIQKIYQGNFNALAVGSGIIVRKDKLKRVLYSLENFPYSLVKDIEISRTYVKSISMTWKIKDTNLGSYIDNAFLFGGDNLENSELFNPPMAGFTTAKTAVSFITLTTTGVTSTVESLYFSPVYTSYWSVDRTHAQLTTGGLFSMPLQLASPSYYDIYSWSLPNYKPNDLPMIPIYASVAWTVPNYTPQALLYIEGNVLVRVYADVHWNDGSTTSMMLDVPIPVKQIFNVVVPND
ncbi:hypothetical protein GM182_06805 [bacterium 3DAC]|nr:hypothetical protein GM182_06805 [bacterium 3DAC]